MTAAPLRPRGALAGSGMFTVERGASPVARLLARALRLPAAGDAVPVRLTVTRDARGETWERDIGGRRLVTRQYMCGDRLVELAGRLRLELAGTVAGGALTLTATRVSVCRVPVPRWLAPRVVATVRGGAGSVDVDVAISLPYAGLLLRYGGPLAIEEV